MAKIKLWKWPEELGCLGCYAGEDEKLCETIINAQPHGACGRFIWKAENQELKFIEVDVEE